MNPFPFGFKFSAPTPPESPRNFVAAPLNLPSSSNSPSPPTLTNAHRSPSPPTLMLSLCHISPSSSYQMPSLPSCSYQMPSTSFAHASPSTTRPEKNKKSDDLEEVAARTKRTKENITANHLNSNRWAPLPTPPRVSLASIMKRTRVPDQLRDSDYRSQRKKNIIFAKKAREARLARAEYIAIMLYRENESEVEHLKGMDEA
ncbi:pH-response transcription factor pacC/RIM101-like isoform X2 [Tetranychus urticae]|uniref:Uncharacterized protein n=1 Tax=Tetranychus urticae TaxID=32264 RepID=T1JS44_TETUR|nr:pH-response transcription factor pacC/RIM101-like isoform X2 [Tetranychus urticae]